MENVYKALKSFALEEDQVPHIIAYLKNNVVKEDCHEQIHYFLKKFAEESGGSMENYCLRTEDLDYEYYTVNVDALPHSLLNIIYKFLCLHSQRQ
jgi:hypothetical protein